MPRTRDPARTRRALVEAAFREIRRKGFQAASLNDILAATGMTKGALYHHFADKQALGYAVLEEIIAETILRDWAAPLESCTDPIDCLQQILQGTLATMTEEEVELGDPLNNLALEMSPLDEEFRRRINDIYVAWYRAIALALVRGQEAGRIAEAVDPVGAAIFVVGALAGCRGMAKHAQSLDVLASCIRCLGEYLESLRA